MLFPIPDQTGKRMVPHASAPTLGDKPRAQPTGTHGRRKEEEGLSSKR